MPPESRVLERRSAAVGGRIQAGRKSEGEDQADRQRRRADRRLDRGHQSTTKPSSTFPADRTCRRSRASSGNGGGSIIRNTKRALTQSGDNLLKQRRNRDGLSSASSAHDAARRRSAVERGGIDSRGEERRLRRRAGRASSAQAAWTAAGRWRGRRADGRWPRRQCRRWTPRSEGGDGAPTSDGRSETRARQASGADGRTDRAHEFRRHRILGRDARTPTRTASAEVRTRPCRRV